MNKQTYAFNLTSGSIPGIPSDQPDGLFHAGLLVDVDLDSMKVLATRLVNTTTGETAASKGLVDLSTGEEPELSAFMKEKEEVLAVEDDQKTAKLKKSELQKDDNTKEK